MYIVEGKKRYQKDWYQEKKEKKDIRKTDSKKKEKKKRVAFWIERVQPINSQEIWPIRSHHFRRLANQNTGKRTNQKRGDFFYVRVPTIYLVRESSLVFWIFDTPIPCNVNITKLWPRITFCWWTRRQWVKSWTNWFKTKSWPMKWESLFAIILPGRGVPVPWWEYYPGEVQKLSMLFAVLFSPWRETIWWRCIPTQTQKTWKWVSRNNRWRCLQIQTQKTWKCVFRNIRVFIWEETYTWLQNKMEYCWRTRIPWVIFTFH